MSNVLAAYFSASGVTRAVLQRFAKVTGADIFEIRPEVPYTDADLDWRDSASRSSIEMGDKRSRVALAEKPGDIAQYDWIVVGYPVWWYTAPHIINTFLEGLDLRGKKIALIATSGSSGLGNVIEDLKPSAPGADFIGGQRVDAYVSERDLLDWAKSLGIC